MGVANPGLRSLNVLQLRQCLVQLLFDFVILLL